MKVKILKHLNKITENINENVLSKDLSPYLKQHKDNPVNWQIWSKETLEFSKQIKKPILLSIGYASCHWCHVMAHESFEDIATSKLMNEHFINIKKTLLLTQKTLAHLVD